MSEYDETVTIDQDVFRCLEAGLATLRRTRPPTKGLFHVTQKRFATEFVNAGAAAGITAKLHTYQLRHSGPSHDKARNLRSFLEIKLRGRWLSNSSLRRYDKEVRDVQQLGSLEPRVRQQALRVLARLQARLRQV